MNILKMPQIVKIRRALSTAIQKKLPNEVIVVSVPERTSRRINRAYRGKGAPANVLSFRYGDDYGEILVCPSVIRREANPVIQPRPPRCRHRISRKSRRCVRCRFLIGGQRGGARQSRLIYGAKRQENSYHYQLTRMVIHGMLHLAGIHHENSRRAAKRAEALERSILESLFPKSKVKSQNSKVQVKIQK